MGIDGFSLSNLNLNLNKTSAAMASEADVIALQGNESQIKSIDGTSKKQKAARKDKDSGFGGTVILPGDAEELKTPQKKKKLQEKKIDLSDEELEKYHFRLNKEHMIEIFDSDTDEIIRTITPEDAAIVLMNISEVPGIIFNKKI